MSKVQLNYEDTGLGFYFKYSEESPSCLAKQDGTSIGFVHTTKKTPLEQGWAVKYKRINYIVARIIWYITYGEVPTDKVIDHIDGNRLNNNIKNLRLVSQDTNNKITESKVITKPE